MKTKTLVTTALISCLLTPSMVAEEPEVDLFDLCSKFPQNTKCKNFEAPIPLEKREGETVGCQFSLGESLENQACKVEFTEEALIIYQEQGDKIEQLDNKRLTTEYQIPLEQIAIHNHQVWGKIHRWQITYLIKSPTTTDNSINSLTLLAEPESSEVIASQLKTRPLTESWRLIARVKASNISNSILGETSEPQQLTETEDCAGCDLQNANLAGMDLTGYNLEGANLQGANLQGANLTTANLSGAYLVGANLREANLTEANLGGTNFTLATLTKANLQVAGLQAVNFQGADLREADLQGAYLRAPAFLQEADLTQANLTDADLRGANLVKANLTQANLQNANLKDTNVKLKDIPGNYNFGERLFDALVFPVFSFSNRGVDFKTDLQGANLQSANLQGATLEEVFVTDANLNNADLTDAKLEETNLEEASTCGAIMPDGTDSDDC